mgnify:CR=1 FL=1
MDLTNLHLLSACEAARFAADLLSQAEHHARLRGAWPVVALDDLASELDRHHQQRVLEWLLWTGAQLFVTGTEPPPALAALGALSITRFHVEQGQLRPEA